MKSLLRRLFGRPSGRPGTPVEALRRVASGDGGNVRLVSVAGSPQRVALLRKLHSLGTRTMLLFWDLQEEEEEPGGQPPTENPEARTLRASRSLTEEATYAVRMNRLVDDAYNGEGAPLLDDLFVTRATIPPESGTNGLQGPPREATAGPPHAAEAPGDGAARAPHVVEHEPDPRLGAGGMGTDLFFLKTDLEDAPFARLQLHDHVTFVPGRNERGPCALRVRVG
jgi:hypothetical protein